MPEAVCGPRGLPDPDGSGRLTFFRFGALTDIGASVIAPREDTDSRTNIDIIESSEHALLEPASVTTYTEIIYLMQGRLRPRGAQAVGNFLPGMTTNRRARFWRVGCVLLLVLMLAARADAEPQIKVSGCEIRDTNYVDPIASTDHLAPPLRQHLHHRPVDRRSLFDNKTTTCHQDWFTSAGWFPVGKVEPVSRISVYYRAPATRPKFSSFRRAYSFSEPSTSTAATQGQDRSPLR